MTKIYKFMKFIVESMQLELAKFRFIITTQNPNKKHLAVY